MAESRPSPAVKLHHLDLARKRIDSDKAFESIINKLPDLYLPRAYRLAGEDDYFNETIKIKLSPFKKQTAPGTIVTSNALEDHAEQKSLHSYHDIKRGIGNGLSRYAASNSPRPVGITDQEEARRRPPRVFFSPSKDFSRLRKAPTEIRGGRNSSFIQRRSTTPQPSPSGLLSSLSDRSILRPRSQCSFSHQTAESRQKFWEREKLNRKYSGMRLRKATNDLDSMRLGFDKLFHRKPAPDYPFANPMPNCMTTEENIDNLREIIVSSSDIEWKMLTPIRPESEYDEEYFDKLIYLHRARHKSRLESGYYLYRDAAPFKHSRHGYMFQPFGRHVGSQRSTFSPTKPSSGIIRSFRTLQIPNLGPKFRLHLRDKRRKSIRRLSTAKMTIPTLTLTSDETLPSKPLEARTGVDDDDDDDSYDFDYDKFSRFSRQNVISANRLRQQEEQKQQQRFVEGGHNENPILAQQSHNEINQLLGKQDITSDQLEDQVEDMIGYLASSNLI